MLPISEGKVAMFFDEDSVELDSSCKKNNTKRFRCDYFQDSSATIYVHEGVGNNQESKANLEGLKHITAISFTFRES